MINIEITTEGEELIRSKLRNLGDKAPKALQMAINDTAGKTKTEVSKEVRSEYVIKVADVNAATKIQKANPGNLSAEIRYSGPVRPLFKFKASANNPKRGGRAAKAKAKKAGAMKPLVLASGNGVIKGFVASMKSGHTSIFQRRPGKKRGVSGEIRDLLGPSVPNMVHNNQDAGAYDRLDDDMADYLTQRLAHHIGRYTDAK